MRSHIDHLTVPPARRSAIEQLGEYFVAGRSVVLSTHMNADGDGCGSETALGLLLAQRGMHPRIVNPTAWPELFDFLRTDRLPDLTAAGASALDGAELLMVLDISDVKRLGGLADRVRKLPIPKLVIDHHIPGDDPPASIMLADTAACATGELIFDLACVLDLDITPDIARALYVAILTDTGSFRFSNATPRCHAIAGQLLSTGVDPEEMYVRIYASAPPGRLRLLADVLSTLDVDLDSGLAWLSMNAGAMEKYHVRGEDLDGIVEHARSIAGTRMALFFRDLGHGKVKLSFRSTGAIDVNAFAREFGGGGHAKAAGALIGGSLSEVRERVVAAARRYLAAHPPSTH
jgi:phosphoesterase RecJ-like protein